MLEVPFKCDIISDWLPLGSVPSAQRAAGNPEIYNKILIISKLSRWYLKKLYIIIIHAEMSLATDLGRPVNRVVLYKFLI